MITLKQQIMLFSKFGIPDEPYTDGAISYIQKHLTPAQWVDYIDELKNIMLDNLDNHTRIVTKLNTDQATSYLLLVADRNDKAEALLKALDLYSF